MGRHKKVQLNFNAAEQEVIYLKAIQELLDSMVNHEIFDLQVDGPNSLAIFKTNVHQRLFYILLVDFLSESSAEIAGKKQTYLGAINNICTTPCFNKNDSVNDLRTAANGFAGWLSLEITYNIHMPSINRTENLSLKREDIIYICGNISKHNFTRLSRVRRWLCEIMESNNISISYDESMLIIGDIYERFHDDILIYHSSTIAEFINNIRWGIHEYLFPEYSRSVILLSGNPTKYSYTYPDQIKTDFAKSCYWGLMNAVRSKPSVRRFQVASHLKKDTILRVPKPEGSHNSS